MTEDVTPTPALDDDLLDPASVIPPGAGTPPGGIQPELGTLPPAARRTSADVTPRRPSYKGEELDAARGPGLGCFWFQAAVLAFFLVLIPIGITLNWPFEVLAALLFVALGLLLFVGQTLIFLLRLVAADRREAGRRRPLASATPTVGELEDGLPGVPGTDEALGATGVPGARETTSETAGTAPEAPEAAGTDDATAPDGAGSDDATAAMNLSASPTAEPGSEGVRE